MKYKTRIFLVIILGIIFLPTVCLAKTININGVDYKTDTTTTGDGFVFDATTNTLTIENIDVKRIKYNDDLKIIVLGKNTITNPNYTCIEAVNIEITGTGELNLTGARGISGRSIVINGAKIGATTTSFSLVASSTEEKSIHINDATLHLASDDSPFNAVSAGVYINNSDIVITKANELFGGFTESIHLENSTFKVESCETVSYSSELLYIDGFSYVEIMSLNDKYSSKYYKLGDGLKIYGSADGIIFHEIEKEESNKYIRVMPDINIEELLAKEKKLQQQEKELNERLKEIASLENKLKESEDDIKKREQELEERFVNLNLQESELNQKQTNLNLKEDALNKQILDLNSKSNTLEKKQNRLFAKEETLALNENTLANLKKELDLKEATLKKDLESLNIKKKETSELEVNLKAQKQELSEEFAVLLEFETSLKNKEKNLQQKEEELSHVKNINQTITTTTTTNTLKTNSYKYILGFALLLLVSLTLGILLLIKKRRSNG